MYSENWENGYKADIVFWLDYDKIVSMFFNIEMGMEVLGERVVCAACCGRKKAYI